MTPGYTPQLLAQNDVSQYPQYGTQAHHHAGEQTNNYIRQYEHRQCAMHP